MTEESTIPLLHSTAMAACSIPTVKTHMFNLLEKDGTPKYCESDGFIPGKGPASCTIEGLRVGYAICYDLRFANFFDKMAESGTPDIIVVPSAFTKSTGRAHWEVLLRARAIERQCYILAANQTGQHAPNKESYGHSMIIDPWGRVLANTGDTPGVITSDMDMDIIDHYRGLLPALRNRIDL